MQEVGPRRRSFPCAKGACCGCLRKERYPWPPLTALGTRAFGSITSHSAMCLHAGKEENSTEMNVAVSSGEKSQVGADVGRFGHVGTTTKRNDEIDGFIQTWKEDNPKYSFGRENCQKFAREFIGWLTDESFEVPPTPSLPPYHPRPRLHFHHQLRHSHHLHRRLPHRHLHFHHLQATVELDDPYFGPNVAFNFGCCRRMVVKGRAKNLKEGGGLLRPDGGDVARGSALEVLDEGWCNSMVKVPPLAAPRLGTLSEGPAYWAPNRSS